MISLPWILISIGILLILTAIISLSLIRKKNTKPDYYVLFIIGLFWMVMGVPLKNYVLSVTGLIFVIVSLFKRHEWKKNRFDLRTFNKKQMIEMGIVIGSLVLLLIIIIILSIMKG